jgi:methylated-DNA-[protein]-cysteine S-methyltransferase
MNQMINQMNSLIQPSTHENSVIFYTRVASPMGYLLLLSDGTNLTGLYTDTHLKFKLAAVNDGIDASPTDRVRLEQNDDALPFAMARGQLAEYFAGRRNEFSIPLAPEGSEFQRRVWQELRAIPSGQTISYAELARRVGNPKASRAVGLANGRNPISIVIPCHRVIGSDGSMTGYAGGLAKKEFLLKHELRIMNCLRLSGKPMTEAAK